MNVRRIAIPAAFTVLGILIGGSGAQAEPVTVTKEVPVERVVTKTVPGPERVVTKEVEKRVEVASAACMDFVDAADAVMLASGEAFGTTSEFMTAASEFDVATMLIHQRDLEEQSEDLQPLLNTYRVKKAACVPAGM